MSEPLTRGTCPDALAIEVYHLTHAALHRRFRTPSAHKTAVPEAVGAAFTRWLGSAADKTEVSAKLHAFWLTKTATVFLLGGAANIERRGRGVRCIATSLRAAWQGEDDGAPTEIDLRESIWRAHYEVAEAGEHEDNIIGALDTAQAAYHGKACATWREALACLIARGWTRCHLADALGVSYSLVLRYLNPALDIAPRQHRQDTLLALAAEDRFPPSHEAITVAPTYRKRRGCA
jgi:hypothetical protein